MNLSYIAGFFDGEGSITIYKAREPNYHFGYRHRLIVRICNTDREVLEKIRRIIGIQGHLVIRDARNPRWKTMYDLRYESNQAEMVLRKILPYLEVKKQEAKLALKLRNLLVKSRQMTKENFTKREDVYMQMKQLHRKR